MGSKLITSDAKFLEFSDNISLKELSKEEKKKIFQIILDIFGSQTGVNINHINDYTKFFGHWYKLDGEWYYFKDYSDNQWYHGTLNELLGEVISEYFGLRTAHYKLAKVRSANGTEKIGVVSKNFCEKEYSYSRPLEYGFELIDDLSIFRDIKRMKIDAGCIKIFSDDLKKLLIRDFYSSERDRCNINILLAHKDNFLKLCDAYDYATSFLPSYTNLGLYSNTIMTLDLNLKNHRKFMMKDSKIQELLYLLMDACMDNFLDMVQERHHILIPDEYREEYTSHDKKIKELVKDNKLV